MKFNGFVIIEKPQDIVAEYFADPAYLGAYQDGFEKKELIEGQEGQVGLYLKYIINTVKKAWY